jgi:hypothetical protein
MEQQRLRMMTKDSLLDCHFYLHVHEIIPGRWLRPRNGIHARIFPKFLCGGARSYANIGLLIAFLNGRKMPNDACK